MAEEAPLCTLPSTDREYAFLLIAIKNVNLTYYIINITMNTIGWEEAKAQKIDVIILHLNILKIIPTTVEHRQTSTGTGMSFCLHIQICPTFKNLPANCNMLG